MTMSKNDEYIAKKSKRSPEFKKSIEKEAAMTGLSFVVKSLRDELGLSQVEFAKLVGKPQSTISRIEAGEMNPSFQLLNEIAYKTDKKIEIKFV